jgi:hypothetical protein
LHPPVVAAAAAAAAVAAAAAPERLSYVQTLQHCKVSKLTE